MYIQIPRFAYPFIHQWKCSSFSAIVNNAAMERGCTNISLRPCFKCFWVHIQKWKYWVTWFYSSIFNFMRNYYAVFHSSCILYFISHQHKCSNFSISSPTLFNINHPNCFITWSWQMTQKDFKELSNTDFTKFLPCPSTSFCEKDFPVLQFSSIQSLSCVNWLLATPWTAARQASLSFTNSQCLLKLMSIESVMPADHLILCRPLLLLPSIFPSSRVFSNESVL